MTCMVFSNLFNNIYIYIYKWTCGHKRQTKEKKERKEMGRCRGDARNHHPRAFANPMVKRALIVTKFQTVIVFNVVNTSMELDFQSHGSILLYR